MHATPEPDLRLPALVLPALLALFVAGLFPLTADYVLFHPDERHYVDAGMRMVQSGDYLTPRTAEGQVRLKKPIVPYWCTAAGFQTVGVSPLGARLGFLLAGAAVVGLAWWGAVIAFESRRAACFAALAAMTQPALLISAPRSVPDVCLALGIQLGVCGCLLILKSPRTAAAGWACAWAGGTAAILSKGLPAAAFLGFTFVYLACRHTPLLRRDWRRCAITGAACLIVSGSWFALMAVRHPGELALQFVGDQLGPNRFAANAWQALVQLPVCAGLLMAMSGPWLIAIAPTRRTGGSQRLFWKQPAVELLVGWTLVYCLLAALINHVTPRYLLPAAAPLSIVIGGLLNQCDAARLERRLWWVLIAMASAAGAACAGAEALLSDRTRFVLIGSGAAAAVLMVAVRARRWTALTEALAIAAVLHATLCGGTIRLASALRPDAIGAQLRAQLDGGGRHADAARIIVAGEASQLTRIRVAVGGAIPVVPESSAGSIAAWDVLVFEEARTGVRDLSGRGVTAVACGYHRLATAEVLTSLATGELPALLEDRQRWYGIAAPARGAADDGLQTATVTRPSVNR